MPWCPNCKTEYRKGFTHCSDCGAELTNEPPDKEKDAPERFPIDPVFLASVSTSAESALLTGLLRDAGIPYLHRDRESGSYMKIYMGYSIYGEDILVERSKLSRAQELLETYTEAKESTKFVDMPAEDAAEADENDEDEKRPVRTWILVLLAIVILYFVFGWAWTALGMLQLWPFG